MSFFEFVEKNIDIATTKPGKAMPAAKKPDTGKKSWPKKQDPPKASFLADCKKCGGNKNIIKRKKPRKCRIQENAWHWLNENTYLLLKAGWTRSELFRRGKSARPYENRGVLWLSVWRRPELKIEIEKNTGRIVFIFAGSDGRTVRQSASPGTHRKNIKKRVTC